MEPSSSFLIGSSKAGRDRCPDSARGLRRQDIGDIAIQLIELSRGGAGAETLIKCVNGRVDTPKYAFGVHICHISPV